jgi:hypothetical protein
LIDWPAWAWWLPELLTILEDDIDPWADIVWLVTDDDIYGVGYSGGIPS